MTPKAGARWWDQPQLFASPEVPWTDRRLLGFDLETTDADPLIAQPVSYSFVEFRGRTPIARRKQIVVPKVPVSAGAEAVHGITKEVIERLGVPLETALGSIFEVLTRASEAQVPVVGMNLRFDLIIADTLAARFLGRGLLENGSARPCDRRLGARPSLRQVEEGKPHAPGAVHGVRRRSGRFARLGR